VRTCFGALFRKVLIERFGADAIGVAFDSQFERRITEHDAGYFGQFFAGQRAERVPAGVQDYVRHVHDKTAGGVASFQDQVELLEETGAKLLTVTYGLLKLRVG